MVCMFACTKDSTSGRRSPRAKGFALPRVLSTGSGSFVSFFSLPRYPLRTRVWDFAWWSRSTTEHEYSADHVARQRRTGSRSCCRVPVPSRMVHRFHPVLNLIASTTYIMPRRSRIPASGRRCLVVDRAPAFKASLTAPRSKAVRQGGRPAPAVSGTDAPPSKPREGRIRRWERFGGCAS